MAAAPRDADDNRRLRLGVAGLGRAFTLMLPTLVAHPRVELVAAADARPEARARFAADFGAAIYASVEELCADACVEAVYVATPHQHHGEHAIAAAARGKHVLVEKPMALSLQEGQAMIAAARDAGVRLVVGHSHSFDAPIRRARAIIASGAVGPVRMVSALNYTDYLYRPRRPEELDTASGGGVLFSQAAHQADIVRLLCGGRARSVRALAGAWDARRPTQGAYSALVTFEGGAFATMTYSGYGHFDSDELCGWVSELGNAKDASRYGAARRALARATTLEEEARAKNERAYGAAQPAKGAGTAPWHEHFGLVIASCERADLRPMPTGVMVYGDDAQRLEALDKPPIPRAEVIDELWEAIFRGVAPLHDGEWALATLEVCLAMLRSAREGSEVMLGHQVAART